MSCPSLVEYTLDKGSQRRGRATVSQVNIPNNPAFQDEDSVNRTEVVAARKVERWSGYALWIVLGLAVLVIALAYFAARQSGITPGATGSTTVDTAGSSAGNTGTSANRAPTDSSVSGGAGATTGGGVPSSGASTGSGSTTGGTTGTTGTTSGAGTSGSTAGGGATSGYGGR